MGGHGLDRGQDRRYGGDPAALGTTSQKDSGERAGVTSAERGRIKELEREVRGLLQANEILRKASAYFAQAELDRPFKR
jgi:transposase-like protein